jgi:hypothetical protein
MFIPARIMASRTGNDSDAGPRVQTMRLARKVFSKFIKLPLRKYSDKIQLKPPHEILSFGMSGKVFRLGHKVMHQYFIICLDDWAYIWCNCVTIRSLSRAK